MSQLWRQRDELHRLSVKVVIVTFEPHLMDQLSEGGDGPDFPYLFDEDKKLYHHYGMYNATYRDIWGLLSLKAYFKSLLRGGKLLKSKGDVYQRGGDILIDPAGIIRFHHISIGPGSRPPLDTILSVINLPA